MDCTSAHSARLCLLAVGLYCSTLVGCRNDASQRDAYIRDLRMQEDQIYELQDYMTEYQHLLRQQRMENTRLRERLGAKSDVVDKTDTVDDDLGERSLLDRPAPERNEPDEDEDPDLPEIDLGDPDLPDVDLGEPVPGGELEPIPAGDLDEVGQRQDHATTELASATIDGGGGSHLRNAVFDPLPRPTNHADSCAIYAEQMALEPNNVGDDTPIGLVAIVEPLTADGSAGYFTGEVALMLVDPLASDDEWELSRWDFTPEEVEVAWRDESRRVLDLPLAAPTITPIGRPLELWVRLVPTEGDRKILCSTAVTLADPIEAAAVPSSSGASTTEPGSVVSSGWTASDQLADETLTSQRSAPKAWQAAATRPLPAVAKAEPLVKRPKAEPTERTPDWSPFR